MKIKELRKIKNLTQKEIAEKLGCNQSAVGKYERGELEPNLTTLKKLADIFECTVDYLLGREDDFGNVKINTGEASLKPKEERLLQLFNKLDNDEQNKIIEDCEYFANKHIKKNKIAN